MALVGLGLLGMIASPAARAEVLDATDIRIVGLRLAVAGLPKVVVNVPFSLSTTVVGGTTDEGGTVAVPAELLEGAWVRGDLSGPGLAERVPLQARPNEALQIPALTRPGTYVLDRLRLVRVNVADPEPAQGDEEFIVSADPAMLPLPAIDKVMVTQLTTQRLSLEEIRRRGIVIDEKNFTAYRFSIGVKTSSNVVNIPFDVAFPIDQPVAAHGGGGEPVAVGLSSFGGQHIDVQGILFKSACSGRWDCEEIFGNGET